MRLTDKELDLIALMAKRIGFAEFKECAENDDQAYAMRDAFQNMIELTQMNSPQSEIMDEHNSFINWCAEQTTEPLMSKYDQYERKLARVYRNIRLGNGG